MSRRFCATGGQPPLNSLGQLWVRLADAVAKTPTLCEYPSFERHIPN
jgi:hypothetical protein